MPSPSHAPVTSFAPPFGRKSTVIDVSPPTMAGSEKKAGSPSPPPPSTYARLKLPNDGVPAPCSSEITRVPPGESGSL